MLTDYLKFFFDNYSKYKLSKQTAWAEKARVVIATVHVQNIASIKCVEAAGFQRCSCLVLQDATASESPDPTWAGAEWLYYSYQI